MVDFRKRLGVKTATAIIDPVALYETLDRASDKGELRKAQTSILQDWHKNRRDNKDLILKMHTGQGKTLVGLLILYSKLIELKEPVLYLCPTNQLVNQTCMQAKQFGINHCIAEDELPNEFLDGKSILITSVQKLFNGLTKFGIGNGLYDCHR